MTDINEQFEILTASAVDLQVREEFKEKLCLGRPLRVKAGFDPTSPDIHLGHTVVLQQMRRFQELGHFGLLVIGDFTARIGDPTGRNSMRPALSKGQIEENAKTYQEQAFRVLDRARTTVYFNSEWLSKMDHSSIISLLSSCSLARMLERDDFKNRFRTGVEISLHELEYPLLQAQDSVVLEADVELGGTDQLFNLLMGRTLMKQRGLTQQIVLTTPLLEGLSGGEKMSKSLNNYVGVTEAPSQMFGKLMSISDELMWKYYKLLSRKTPEEIVELKKSHPKFAKMELAKEIVACFHGEAAGKKAEAEFERVFSRGAIPEDIPTVGLTKPVSLVRALVATELCVSNTEARRKIREKAVGIDQTLCENELDILPGKHLLRMGRKYAYIVVSED